MFGNRLEGRARYVGGKIENTYGDVTGDPGHQVAGTARQLVGSAQSLYGDTVHGAGKLASDIEDYASDRPWTTLSVGIGVGFVIGLCFRQARF